MDQVLYQKPQTTLGAEISLAVRRKPEDDGTKLRKLQNWDVPGVRSTSRARNSDVAAKITLSKSSERNFRMPTV